MPAASQLQFLSDDDGVVTEGVACTGRDAVHRSFRSITVKKTGASAINVRTLWQLARLDSRDSLDCLRQTADRPEALRIAYRECGITMTGMAKELQLSVSRISRLIAAAEAVEGGLVARGKT